MIDERLREVFAHMGPSDEAKRRMLANILAAGGQHSDDGAHAGNGGMDALDGGTSHFSRIASSSAGPSRSGMDALDGGTSHPIVGAPSLDDACHLLEERGDDDGEDGRRGEVTHRDDRSGVDVAHPGPVDHGDDVYPG